MDAFSTIIILTIILVIALFGFALKKANKGKVDYDERQLVIRGKGYQYGFVTAISYMTLYGLLSNSVLLKDIPIVVAFFAGMFISGTVFISYCIINDAFLSFAQNRKHYMILCVMVALIDGLNFYLSIKENTFFIDGEINGNVVINGFVGLMFTIAFILLAIKAIIAKNDAE